MLTLKTFLLLATHQFVRCIY